MKVSFVSAVLAVLPAWVNAVVITNSNFDDIEVGKPFEVTWSDAAGPVSLTLKDGPSDNLKTVSELTSGETGTSYTWVPSSDLSSGTYALEINDGSDVNYSQQFEISGGSASGTSASSTVSETSTSSAISSSSTIASTTSSATLTSSASVTSSETSSAPTSSSASSGSSSFVTSTSSGSTSATTSSSTHASSTSSATKTSAATPDTVPNTNAAQTVAPFVAPMLLAVGAIFM
ncbi:Ser-Thr-rich glycosyl-phosphatidyl-inositol-anchored membrane family-domain-containing protein [Daldinia caldariorum]|uniref:Ser-Thr-rich glycosyl-phosphatidyl-inositol-anchored membrane family-domain-containing protein n=1 Tax=Daldinia caldariorum TaxID=326644 RepID=UPI0020085DB6|nr:Ser-Thr-rich glycosyl-phosphatidyl-inositol-anchored membrane family-domain-containing protein [Daldinia caldariorum]KAI1468637.1 Ser-Thr-rich glycosyl-phosphatidyl-inositol-anchored membrane family-domain-containing protein [Daldinia caldariorum]